MVSVAAHRHLYLTVGPLSGLLCGCLALDNDAAEYALDQDRQGMLPNLPAGMTGQFETLCFVRDSKDCCDMGYLCNLLSPYRPRSITNTYSNAGSGQ